MAAPAGLATRSPRTNATCVCQLFIYGSLTPAKHDNIARHVAHGESTERAARCALVDSLLELSRQHLHIGRSGGEEADDPLTTGPLFDYGADCEAHLLACRLLSEDFGVQTHDAAL